MKKIFSFKFIFTFALMFIISSCLPEQQQVPVDSGTSDQSSTVDDEVVVEEENPTLPQVVNFLQQGSTDTTTTLSLFSDFKDTFLLRGNDIIAFLKDQSQSSQSNFCMTTNFTGASGATAKNILVLSARIRSFYSTTLKTREYFLQFDPNNKDLNQTDCLSVSLVNKLNSVYGSTNITYSMDEICPDCNTNISSTSLRLFNLSGVEFSSSLIAHLNLSVIPGLGSTSTGTVETCSINANCISSGFNCCLSGQCVNHGEVRPETLQSSDEYLAALQLVLARPELIKNYEHLFYVCPMMVPTTEEDPEDIDPVQNANDLFTELTRLYECTTPQVDEFSICTMDYNDASTLMNGSSHDFLAGNDDKTFDNINSFMNGTQNIVQIDYAGRILYKDALTSEQTNIALPSYITLGVTNDSLTQAQVASINTTLPEDATNDTVSISYKVDGTCEKLGTSLARCMKYYKQAQISTPSRSSDHASGNNTFNLPTYFDSDFNVIVEVGGSIVPKGTTTWSSVGNSIVFNSSTFPVVDNQEISISYFVTDDVDMLTVSKELAQSGIDDHCACDPLKDPCTLKPIQSEVGGELKTTSYVCIYPQPDVPNGPLQETVYVSAKSVPHKFYDEFGVNYDLGDVASENVQEGLEFEYTDGNNLKPNNVGTYIGFNEIYGTMNLNEASPLPPKVVNVDKGTTYDIFVDEGAFSTCLNCGSDYFSNMQKVFPNNFNYKGAGYYANLVESRRRKNQSKYPGDDFKFGRACFVPASMMPWTHSANTDVKTQRNNRLAAQHFLYSNGMNKDWYGFDYGSMIGSFDGVKWFSIGNQRRIKAESNKLYLAVNAYFGDLTINNTFKLMISEISSVLNSGSFINHDSDSDGAECQRAHFCESDNDCLTNLGYEYTCQNVSEFQTPWPQFDSNGNEISGSISRSLLSLVGGSNGQAKRCVYRGPGAICEQRQFSVNSSSSYASTSNSALHACSPNSYCESLNSSKFNNNISRYADSPTNQNIQTFITEDTDTFGLAARILGRPYKYYGDEAVNSTARTQLNNTKINSVCIPGKDTVNVDNTEDANFIAIENREADKISNVGRTMSSLVSQDENYLSFCPGTDDEGNYTHLNDVQLNDSSHKPFAIKENLSSNSLILDSLEDKKLFNDTTSLVTSIGYHKNTCLRAPGAKCFSDFECAPNEFISQKFKSVSNFNGEISEAEEKFWEEELICGNSQNRYQEGGFFPNPVYETYENHCCRETGKEFTYFTQKHEGSDFKVVNDSDEPLIPGVNQDYNSPERYSRTHTVYDKLISEPTKYPSMVSASEQPVDPLAMTLEKIKQYNTLHLHNERMCCTGHWVRKLESSDANRFGPTSQQNIELTTFKPLNWYPNNIPAVNIFPNGAYDPTIMPYACDQFDVQTTDCEIKNLIEGNSEETKYLEWFSKFELIGIPQVLIETNNEIPKPMSTEAMDTNGDGTDDTASQQDISGLNLPLDNTIKDANSDGKVDATFNGKEYYSASSYENFEMGSGKLKKIFSEDEFNCCIPTGIEVDANLPPSSCCTGQIDGSSGVNRCCLPDFTDLSVYTNRYVSSEGAFFNGQKINDSDIDPTTGYIKKEIVLQMASTMCCGGKAVLGRVIKNNFIPTLASQPVNVDGAQPQVRRWQFLNEMDNADNDYNIGVKWNNHVYCIGDQDLTEESDSGSGGGGGGAVQE